jgi:hypothetical protein
LRAADPRPATFDDVHRGEKPCPPSTHSTPALLTLATVGGGRSHARVSLAAASLARTSITATFPAVTRNMDQTRLGCANGLPGPRGHRSSARALATTGASRAQSMSGSEPVAAKSLDNCLPARHRFCRDRSYSEKCRFCVDFGNFSCSAQGEASRSKPASRSERTTTKSAGGDSCFSAKEQSWRTAWRACSLLRRTTTSSHHAAPGAIATRDCASWRRIARAIACASERQLAQADAEPRLP